MYINNYIIKGTLMAVDLLHVKFKNDALQRFYFMNIALYLCRSYDCT